jgi:cobalt/nickel transport system permease protein
MHIAEGVLSAPVLLSGAALSAAGAAVGLKRMDWDRIMTVGMLSAVFFTASLIHVPLGPFSAHLVLNGLMGALLGWAAFPAILAGLLLQAVLFQYGGLAVLGVNGAVMGGAAVLCHLLFGRALRVPVRRGAAAAFACGFCGVLFSAVLLAASLALTDEGFLAAAKLALLAHIPIMLVEGVVTLFVVSYLAKVRPELLAGTGQGGA